MLSIFAFLAIIVSITNTVTFVNIASTADETTLMIAQAGGRFEEDATGGMPPAHPDNPGGGAEEGKNPPPVGPHSEETPFETAYFSVLFRNDGTSESIMNKVASIDIPTQISIAESVKNSTKGWYARYRYRVHQVEVGTIVVCVDCNRELTPAFTFLWTSIGVIGAGLIISFVLLFFGSKRLVAPIIETDRKEKRFVADASHELKTPITIISANNEILEMEKGESEETQAIAKQVEKLTKMVRDLNSLAQIDEEEGVEMADFSLSDATMEIVLPFEKVFQSKGLEFSKEVEEGITMHGNEKAIRNVISAILDNAAKYSETKAFFALKKQDSRINIIEYNDAKNLPDGDLDKIFERFYRTDEARGSTTEGSGIGLSVVKEQVKMHKGRVRAYAKDGIFNIKVEL